MLVNIVERALEPRSSILGDAFSAVAVMLGFGPNIARHLYYVNDRTPRVRDYREWLTARPAYVWEI